MLPLPRVSSPPAPAHLATFGVAVLVPVLMALSRSPSPTVLNQLAALFGWGTVALVVGLRGPTEARGAWRSPLIVALALVAGAVVWSMNTGLADSIGYSALAIVLAAMLMARLGQEPGIDVGGRAFFRVLLAAALASSAIGLVQVFAPQWCDGTWLARSATPGIAVGNVRQPNHLSSVLVWGLVALVVVARPTLLTSRHAGQQAWRALAWAGVAALLAFAVVLTGSRTGALSMAVLALWGLLDRRLPGATRLTLLALPLLYALGWWAMAQWAAAGQAVGSVAHLRAGFDGGDISSSRFRIWADTLTLIRQQPLSGVGFGEFNFAWSLTPLPDRPVAFFDHTHNLPLHLLVELGVPLGGAVLLLLLAALVQAGARAWGDRSPASGTGARAAFVMVLLMGLHSLLEYPLWFAYFLLPTAWAWGMALRLPSLARRPCVPTRLHWPALAGVSMAALTLFAVGDYLRVSAIYTARQDAPPLAERIAQGQASVFYGAQADYAAATNQGKPAAFSRATHTLLDTRLMVAWAQMLAATNHVDHARHIAQRLREFRNPAAHDFFAPCAQPGAADFQCQTPSQPLTWRDFEELHQ